MLDDAFDVWQKAEKDYRDESARYVAIWWANSQTPKSPEKVFDLAAIGTLTRMRADAQTAQDAYEDTYKRFRAEG